MNAISSSERNEKVRLAPANVGIMCVVLFLLASCAIGPTVENVELTTNQTKLASIAMENKDGKIRSAAVRKLIDQSVLATIAVKDEIQYVRQDAVAKLTDQALLATIAIEDENQYVRQDAVKKLNDQSLLAKIAVGGGYSTAVQYAAITKLTDQSLLAKIALDGKYSTRVQFAAITKLTDQSLLAKIALDDRNSTGGRYVALTRIADQSLLAKIAMAGKDTWVREVAVEKLTDHPLLAKIVAEDKSVRVRYAAKRRIASQSEIIGDVEDKNLYERGAGMERHADQFNLKEGLESPLVESSLPTAPSQEGCGREGIPYIQNILAKKYDEVEISENTKFIERIENKLDGLGYKTGKVDGVIDANLRAAIRCFQTMAKRRRLGAITKTLTIQLQIEQGY